MSLHKRWNCLCTIGLQTITIYVYLYFYLPFTHMVCIYSYNVAHTCLAMDDEVLQIKILSLWWWWLELHVVPTCADAHLDLCNFHRDLCTLCFI